MNRLHAWLLPCACAVLWGCATTGKYEAKVNSWKGHDADELIEAWGKPDAVEKGGEGRQILVYARLRRSPLSYAQAQKVLATEDSRPRVYIKCATYFELQGERKIRSVEFRGDECTSKD